MWPWPLSAHDIELTAQIVDPDERVAHRGAARIFRGIPEKVGGEPVIGILGGLQSAQRRRVRALPLEPPGETLGGFFRAIARNRRAKGVTGIEPSRGGHPHAIVFRHMQLESKSKDPIRHRLNPSMHLNGRCHQLEHHCFVPVIFGISRSTYGYTSELRG
jgi:hypothetical protein